MDLEDKTHRTVTYLIHSSYTALQLIVIRLTRAFQIKIHAFMIQLSWYRLPRRESLVQYSLQKSTVHARHDASGICDLAREHDPDNGIRIKV